MNIIYEDAHTLVADDFKPTFHVVDLGLNRGHFAGEMIKLGGKVYGVEANPFLIDQHLKFIEGLRYENVAAAHSEASTIRFYVSNTNSEAGSILFTETEEQETVTVNVMSLEEILQKSGFEKVDLLKIDIEGAETDLLRNYNPVILARRVKQMSVEFHDFLDPTHIPQIEAIKKAYAPYFYIYKFTVSNHGDVLFLSRTHYQLKLINHLQLFLTQLSRPFINRWNNFTRK
jgi:FkbM family methyltransferase